VDDQRLWLLAVARRKVAGLLRQRYRRAEQPLAESHPVADQEGGELHEEVRVAMSALPPPQAEALVLKYVNGLSTEEVSQVIRKSLPATNSLLQRARGALRDAIGPAFAEQARRLS
jgi:RNA polymerase sigma factor (sigma-70 family)